MAIYDACGARQVHMRSTVSSSIQVGHGTALLGGVPKRWGPEHGHMSWGKPWEFIVGIWENMDENRNLMFSTNFCSHPNDKVFHCLVRTSLWNDQWPLPIRQVKTNSLQQGDRSVTEWATDKVTWFPVAWGVHRYTVHSWDWKHAASMEWTMS